MSRAKSCCQWISFRYKSGGCRMTFPGWGRGTPRWVNWVSWFACASIRSEPMATAIASLNPYYVFLSARSGFLWKNITTELDIEEQIECYSSLVSFCINEWKDLKWNWFISSSNFFPRNWRRASWRKRLFCWQMPLTKILLTRPFFQNLSQRLS